MTPLPIFSLLTQPDGRGIIVIYGHNGRHNSRGSVFLKSSVPLSFTACKYKQGDMEEQIEMVGKAFVEHYYQLFDNERASVSALYQPPSMLTFEGQKFLGVDDISSRLQQLPFDHCRHIVSTVDTQPSSAAGSVLIFVSGCLELPGEEHKLRFSQMFHLVSASEGNLFILNDIFRLNYG